MHIQRDVPPISQFCLQRASQIRQDLRLAHQLWKASYSCRIGLASNLAATVALRIPSIVQASASFRHASAISTRLCCQQDSRTDYPFTIASPDRVGPEATHWKLICITYNTACTSTVEASYSCRIGLASNLASSTSQLPNHMWS